jgi:hypothetical protein
MSQMPPDDKTIKSADAGVPMPFAIINSPSAHYNYGPQAKPMAQAKPLNLAPKTTAPSMAAPAPMKAAPMPAPTVAKADAGVPMPFAIIGNSPSAHYNYGPQAKPMAQAKPLNLAPKTTAPSMAAPAPMKAAPMPAPAAVAKASGLLGRNPRPVVNKFPAGAGLEPAGGANYSLEELLATLQKHKFPMTAPAAGRPVSDTALNFDDLDAIESRMELEHRFLLPDKVTERLSFPYGNYGIRMNANVPYPFKTLGELHNHIESGLTPPEPSPAPSKAAPVTKLAQGLGQPLKANNPFSNPISNPAGPAPGMAPAPATPAPGGLMSTFKNWGNQAVQGVQDFVQGRINAIPNQFDRAKAQFGMNSVGKGQNAFQAGLGAFGQLNQTTRGLAGGGLGLIGSGLLSPKKHRSWAMPLATGLGAAISTATGPDGFKWENLTKPETLMAGGLGLGAGYLGSQLMGGDDDDDEHETDALGNPRKKERSSMLPNLALLGGLGLGGYGLYKHMQGDGGTPPPGGNNTANPGGGPIASTLPNIISQAPQTPIPTGPAPFNPNQPPMPNLPNKVDLPPDMAGYVNEANAEGSAARQAAAPPAPPVPTPTRTTSGAPIAPVAPPAAPPSSLLSPEQSAAVNSAVPGASLNPVPSLVPAPTPPAPPPAPVATGPTTAPPAPASAGIRTFVERPDDWAHYAKSQGHLPGARENLNRLISEYQQSEIPGLARESNVPQLSGIYRSIYEKPNDPATAAMLAKAQGYTRALDAANSAGWADLSRLEGLKNTPGSPQSFGVGGLSSLGAFGFRDLNALADAASQGDPKVTQVFKAMAPEDRLGLMKALTSGGYTQAKGPDGQPLHLPAVSSNPRAAALFGAMQTGINDRIQPEAYDPKLFMNSRDQFDKVLTPGQRAQILQDISDPAALDARFGGIEEAHRPIIARNLGSMLMRDARGATLPGETDPVKVENWLDEKAQAAIARIAGNQNYKPVNLHQWRELASRGQDSSGSLSPYSNGRIVSQNDMMPQPREGYSPLDIVLNRSADTDERTMGDWAKVLTSGMSRYNPTGGGVPANENIGPMALQLRRFAEARPDLYDQLVTKLQQNASQPREGTDYTDGSVNWREHLAKMIDQDGLNPETGGLVNRAGRPISGMSIPR